MSDLKYRDFFETFGDPLQIIRDGRFVDCNPATLVYLGYEKKEDVLVPPWKLSPPYQPDGRASEEKAKAMVRIGMERGLHRFEWLHLTSDGQELPVEVSLTAGRNDAVDTLLSSWRDISERKATEKALCENEMKLHAILDHHFQLTGLITPEGRVCAANQTALRMVGAEESEVLEGYFWDGPWWRDSQRETVRNAVAQAARGEFVRFRTTHSDADSNVHHIDFSLSPVRDEDGKVVYLVPEGRDITDMIHAEEARLESLARFSGFAEASQYGMGMADTGGRVVVPGIPPFDSPPPPGSRREHP